MYGGVFIGFYGKPYYGWFFFGKVLCVKFIFFLILGIGFDIITNLEIGYLVSDDVVVEGSVPSKIE